MSAPAVAGRLHIVLDQIAPGQHEGHDDAQQAGFDRLGRVGVHLPGKPQRQRDAGEPDRLPGELEQQQRQHLERIAQAQKRDQR
ncbi:MAG: hypothetical protein JOZ72_02630 [Alphaproteobacteria bacterium]|nr:hypothetical protein [Alphaproteobacteria bacterium]